jgi:hypothetical protein
MKQKYIEIARLQTIIFLSESSSSRVAIKQFARFSPPSKNWVSSSEEKVNQWWKVGCFTTDAALGVLGGQP